MRIYHAALAAIFLIGASALPASDAIEQHMERAKLRQRLQQETQEWLNNRKRPSYQWSHERVREAVAALTQIGRELVLSEHERAFLGPINPDAMLMELDQLQQHRNDRR